jgi:hypothetical protein
MPDAAVSSGRSEPDRFRPLFAVWAIRLRRRLLARWALTGLAVGLAVSIAPAVLAWKTGYGAVRPWCALGGAIGAAVGLGLGWRRRWSDVDVALWLDDRLGTGEVITTAVGLAASGDRSADSAGAGAVVVDCAARALDTGAPRGMHPRVFRPVHALAPIAAAILVLLSRTPVAARPHIEQPTGQALVRLSQSEGLTRIAQLEHADARDALQHERLSRIARQAEALRADLQRGLERREALDRVERLRDEIAAERLTLGDGAERPGLEAAISRLEQTEGTQRSAQALGDHDLERMDREMERIANLREKRDRESAKRALLDAADAAKAAGAPGVAKSLAEEAAALRGREKRAELLRDLADALESTGGADGQTRTRAEALDRRGNDEAARKLADALGRALEKLSAEERKRLAEKLRQRARSGGTQEDAEDLKDLAGDLSTPKGREKLDEELKELAKEDDESAESSRQRALDDAEDGADGAEGELGGREPGEHRPGGGGAGLPIPLPGGADPPGQARSRSGGTGGNEDAAGAHEGASSAVAGAGSLKSRAHASVNRAPGMAGATTGWTPGNSGATASVQGTGALGSVAPLEIDGVDRSDVPEEYREQVRQYFQP